jgi:hypothetical protein
VNTNQFAGFGDDALASIEDAGSTLQGQQAQAEKNLNVGRNTAIQRGRNTSRGVNTTRAMNLGVDSKYMDAMGDLYTNFS